MPAENKDIKQQTGAGNSFPRLTSFRGARDLSLAGPSASTSKPKRTLKPNFITRKTKNERAIDEALKIHSNIIKKADQSVYKGKSHGKGRELVQIQGSLFDDKGLTAHKLSMSSSKSKMHTRPEFQKAQTQIKVEPGESVTQQDLLSQFSFNDNNENNDFDPGLLPRIISADKANLSDGKNPNLIRSFQKLNVKKEPLSDDDSMPTIADENYNVMKVKPTKISEKSCPLTLAERLLLPESDEIILFTFPGVMPGILQSQSDDKVPTEQVENIQSPLDKIAEKQVSEDRLKMQDVQSGQIGTLKVYKSGKTELILNKHIFLSRELSMNCHQELVYIKTDEEKTGSLFVLGNVTSSYAFTPDVIGMMKQQKKDEHV